ncbi:MAG: glycosyltransferase family A protein [Ginsengibacter sp.]
MLVQNSHKAGTGLPFFSVIITTYNRSSLLLRALDSIICQTEHDWEVIIVDDGSTDDTKLTIAPYLAQGKGIKYFWQEPQGAPSAKNKGAFLAKGKYITFLDSDDEYYPCHLQSRKKLLQTHPEVGFLYGGAKVMGNKYVPDRFDYKKKIHLKDCSVGGTFFIKKQIFLSMGGFADIPFSSDAEFYDRIKLAGIIKIKSTDDTYIYHRENTNSITNNISEL